MGTLAFLEKVGDFARWLREELYSLVSKIYTYFFAMCLRNLRNEKRLGLHIDIFSLEARPSLREEEGLV